jgi:drug/metabolite transporter (DMT)-like permease
VSPTRTRFAHLVPLLCLGGAVLFWGTSFTATKSALVSFSPMTVDWLRMVIATLAFAPFWRLVPRPDYRRGDWKLLLLTGLLMPCVYYLLEAYAMTFTTSSQAGVVSAMVPLLVAAGAWLFLKERLGTRPAIAIAISLGAVAVLSLGGSVQASAPNPVLGNLLEFFAMVGAAGSTLVIKHLSTRYSPWLLTGFQALVGVLFFAPGALISHPVSWLAAPVSAWLGVAYLGVFVSLGAFGLYNTALGMLPASRAALAINAVPAVAMVTGWLALGETMSVPQLVACAAIVGAVAFGESGARQAAGEPAGPDAPATADTMTGEPALEAAETATAPESA